MTWAWIARTWLVAALLSFPATIGVVVLSGYRWNPYIIQAVFLGTANLIIVWRAAQRVQR